MIMLLQDYQIQSLVSLSLHLEIKRLCEKTRVHNHIKLLHSIFLQSTFHIEQLCQQLFRFQQYLHSNSLTTVFVQIFYEFFLSQICKY